MANWKQRAVIGLLLWVGTLAALTGLELFPQQQPAHQEPGEPTKPDIDPRTADDRIADYTLWLERLTGVLAVSTIGLWYVTWQTLDHSRRDAARQARDNRISLRLSARAANASRKAAEATDLSAQAAIGMEIPRIHIESVDTDASIPDAGGDADGWQQTLSPSIVVKNFGRTPAFVSETIINAKIATSISRDPEYVRHTKYPTVSVLEPGVPKRYEELLFKGVEEFTAEQITELLSGNATLYIWGKIIFTDFMGAAHERGFIWSWKREVGSFWDRSNAYPKYSYQK
jgi:hypothetical protein